MELRQNTQQVIRVGVLLAKPNKANDPIQPIVGASLSWYYWTQIVRPDNSIIDISSYPWMDIPNCAGCYYLQLSALDTENLGHLTLYIYDVNLAKPIFQTFYVINQNVFDAKYGDSLMKVLPEPSYF